MMDRYGVKHALQSPIFHEKSKRTCFKNFGVEFPLQSINIRRIYANTIFKQYDVKNINQRHISKKSLKRLQDIKWLTEQHHIKEKTLEQISYELEVSDVTVGNYFKKHNIEIKHFIRSSGEKELASYIKSLNYEIITNTRSIITPYELDIFIPSLNIAIEYNGEYWHKNTQKRDNLKNKLCNNQKILLITVWDANWHDNPNEVKKRLKEIFTK